MEQTATPIITKGVGGLYSIRLADGTTVACRARGAFRHEGITPLVGDRVTLTEDGDSDVVIDKISERKNSLIRPPMANLDCLFITMAAASPTPILSTIDKLTAIAEHNQIQPILVITKSELSPQYAEELRTIYTACEFTVFTVSAKEGTGIEALQAYINTELRGKYSFKSNR